MFRIFVYGSLMKGFWNYKNILEGKALFIGIGKSAGKLYHLPQGYPGIVDKAGIVCGEVFEFEDEGLLNQLDRLEGYYGDGENNLYDRILLRVQLDNGSYKECFGYVYSDYDYAQNYGVGIIDGDWRKFISEKERLL